jgi:hypothetical protein
VGPIDNLLDDRLPAFNRSVVNALAASAKNVNIFQGIIKFGHDGGSIVEWRLQERCCVVASAVGKAKVVCL